MANITDEKALAASIRTNAEEFERGKKCVSRKPFARAVGVLITRQEAGEKLGVQVNQVSQALQSFPDRKIEGLVMLIKERAEMRCRM